MQHKSLGGWRFTLVFISITPHVVDNIASFPLSLVWEDLVDCGSFVLLVSTLSLIHI